LSFSTSPVDLLAAGLLRWKAPLPVGWARRIYHLSDSLGQCEMWRFDGSRRDVNLIWDGLWRSCVAEGDEGREVAVVGFNIGSRGGARSACTSTARC
jgi:hypothetical protein